MTQVLDFLMEIWDYFAANILTQPAFLIGFIVLLGYVLLKKPLYESIAGFLKATVGYLILTVGSGGLVNNFRPILVGLKERFNLDAMVIDPYFGQNAVTAGIEETFGRTFSDTMILLLIAFVMNILLVRFKKYTKLRAVFTTGNVQIQQAATAFWILLFCFPDLGQIQILLIMGLILGCYWAVGSNLTVDITQDLTEGAGFAIAHQQMFGVYIFARLSEKMKKNKNNRKLEDVQLPGFLSIFNENMVATSILMLFFFGIILVVLGPAYLIEAGFMEQGQSFFFYILQTALYFAVYLAILQLGVRTFVSELTESFQGISNTLLPGAVPGIDVAATFGFGSPNAVTIGFLFGALGQFITIGLLILVKSPVIVIAGFIPLFFDNAVIAVYANNRGGFKAACIFPFISGVIQVLGSALIAAFIGLSQYGGYIGMFDWATVWPIMTILMKYLGYFGVALVVILLLAIPQLQYRANPEGYFLIAEDYDEYVKKMAAKNA
ncbi:PTS system ascorbate-specific transporter subunit IIC [Enterococcus sp. 7E2_DIV0204]|uniref:Ascorbate-specific PTS system EIIC component n=1 Tax=Candidatus Enterococcus lemimoniae TaxID=1834167 RepID=A0ABZ2T9F7_9ENTE|nr:MULTISPECIES: PTS ascorbate transporter subunit IIC [unclassified Enterococcus]OTN87902.1 PTS system ascorbate-specific transporter subunit IIC [Enterococcus sp. 7E2_DIV0204]OTO70072.1 PTS system ascorbate-specific transporter subunit IIC [Enterococcus sp. 12C11_DIV0727]OTP49421.1 PTS system ascorbate-specific transporter subunit IIC [Enterococcus sp. 7D2_DIV0200]